MFIHGKLPLDGEDAVEEAGMGANLGSCLAAGAGPPMMGWWGSLCPGPELPSFFPSFQRRGQALPGVENLA